MTRFNSNPITKYSTTTKICLTNYNVELTQYKTEQTKVLDRDSWYQSQCLKALVEMTKGVDEQNVPVETHGMDKKNSRSRDMMSTLKSQVVNLKESMGGVKETLEVVEGCNDELDSMKE